MLHLTQPAVSKNIQALEAELDQRLFERGRSARLTVARAADIHGAMKAFLKLLQARFAPAQKELRAMLTSDSFAYAPLQKMRRARLLHLSSIELVLGLTST